MMQTLVRGTLLSAILMTQTASVELFAPGLISTPSTPESFGSLAPGGRWFYYTIHRPDFGGHRIVVSRRSGSTWSAPETVPVSGTWNDREPKITPDGRRLYFSSNRPVAAGDTVRQKRLDLWMAER